MTNREKHVCFNIAVALAAGLFFFVLLYAHPWDYAMRAFAVLSVWGLGPIVFLTSRRGEVEQAVPIHHAASRAGLIAAVVSLLLGVAAVAGLPGLQSATAIVSIAVGTWVAFIAAHAVSTLWQYGRLRQVA